MKKHRFTGDTEAGKAAWHTGKIKKHTDTRKVYSTGTTNKDGIIWHRSSVQTRLLWQTDELEIETRCVSSAAAGKPATPPATHTLRREIEEGEGRKGEHRKKKKSQTLTYTLDL